jgi:hypothetical protein
MTVLAIGDSNMVDACTVEPHARIDSHNIVPVFANKLDRKFVCWAKNGASNHWIKSHIEYFLEDSTWPKNTMLFIGWTSVEREEWPWLMQNISVCGGPDFGVPPAMKAKFNRWRDSLTDEYVQGLNNYWHDEIYKVHQRLEQQNIAHLFWCTYRNFRDVPNRYDWGNSFYNPYHEHGCMRDWFIKQNMLPYPNDPFHYDSDCHQAWSNELAEFYINSNK